MAETLGGLYLRLGLSISELESGFLDAERTVQQNMARLSRQQNLIRLRAEVDIGNLDETADAAQILTVRTQALNQQLSVQRDRIRIAEANLRDMTQRYGENAVLTQRAAVALERERVQLQRFERDLREVERAQRDLNDSQDESTGNLENFSEALNGLARKVVAVATVAEIFDKISESVAESTEKLRELQNQSYELNLPIDETKEFLRQLKLAGGDIGDFEGYIRGITDAYVKGEWDDPEFLALSKHGAQITDATGRLKDFKDITEEVYQAYLKAKDAGEEIEFLQLTGGEAGVRDAIQFFERYKEAKEDAAKVFNADLDAKAFHELDRTMGLVEEQSDELKNAIANIFTPAVNASARSFFEILRDGTEYLTENKEEFKSWGFIAAEAVNTVLDPLKELKNATLNFGDKQADERYKNFLADYNKNLEDYSSHNPFRDYWSWAFGEMFGGVIDRATEKQIEYNNAVKDTTASWADFRREEETALNNDTVLSQYGMKRIQQFKDDLEDLRIELDFGDDDYSKALAENDLWLKRELTDKLQVSLEEENVLRELHAARREKIERENNERIEKEREETQNRIAELTREAADIEYGLTHSAYEKQIRDIERWKEAQLDKAKTTEEAVAVAVNAYAREREAFERELDRIKGKTQDLHEKIFAQEHSQRDVDIMRAQKERAQLYDEGIYDAATIERYYNNELAKIRERAKNSVGDYSKTPHLPKGDGGGFQVISGGDVEGGKLQPPQDFFGDIENQTAKAMEKFGVLAESTEDLSRAQDELSKSFGVIEGDKIISSFNESVNGVVDAQSRLTESLNSGNENLAQALRETAELIKQNQQQNSLAENYSSAKQSGDDSAFDTTAAKTAFNLVQNAGEVAALAGAGTLNPALALGGGAVALFGGLGNTALDAYEDYFKQSQPEQNAAPSVDLTEITSFLQGEMSQLLSDLLTATQGIGESVQNLSEREPPNITVSPTINVDLGGAYVFDNEMKQQLTTEITDNVADAVKRAVQDATSSRSYGYGN